MRTLHIMDTTIRDAHQSLWATRMQIGDMLPILPKMDKVGYWAIEAWGGATFDTALRFLDENPWERLRAIKKHCPKTPLAMLLRGQNLVGYRLYSQEITNRFVKAAHRNGIDVFRVCDCNNLLDSAFYAAGWRNFGKDIIRKLVIVFFLTCKEIAAQVVNFSEHVFKFNPIHFVLHEYKHPEQQPYKEQRQWKAKRQQKVRRIHFQFDKVLNADEIRNAEYHGHYYR